MRRAILILVGVLALGGGALFGYSWMSNRAAAAGLEEWADALRASGYEVTLGGVSVSGFPSPYLTTVDGIEIAKPGDTFAWRWSAPTMFMTGSFGGDGLRVRLGDGGVVFVDTEFGLPDFTAGKVLADRADRLGTQHREIPQG